MNNVNAATFARTSYWLAGASSLLIAIAMVASFLPDSVISDVGTQLCWLSLPLSAVGTFMGQTARGALKKVIDEDEPPTVWKQARNGALFNSILIAVGTIAALVSIVTNLLTILNT
jgi:hypothetical protein